MAHFAKYDANNIVTQVIVVNNEVLNNLSFPESEPIGINFCKSLFGQDTNWAQTSYNASFRYNYAGIGYTFDATAGSGQGAFISTKPFDSWTLDATYQWTAPVPYPNDGKEYYWDESSQLWAEVASA